MVDCCEDGDEPSYYLKAGKFLSSTETVKLSFQQTLHRYFHSSYEFIMEEEDIFLFFFG
jgi:hypothetical protein